MALRKLMHMITKDVKRKYSMAMLILLTYSSLFLGIIITNIYVHTLMDEYIDGHSWPTEIQIYGWENHSPEELGDIVDEIRNIDGVKWVVYPGGGIMIDYAFKYNDENYHLEICWCNVEDPTFPHPKFLVEGRFFKSNNENAIIVESIGKKLLEDLKLFRGTGTTKVQILGVNMTIIGVISSPAIYGAEELLLKGTSIISFYVPLETYLNLVSIARQAPYGGSLNVYVSGGINVKVYENYSVDEVVNKIRKKFPGIELCTVTESERKFHRAVFMSGIRHVILGYLLASVVMVWDVRHRRREIVFLKALGWRVKDILKFFTLRNTFLGFLSAISAVFVTFLACAVVFPVLCSLNLMFLDLVLFLQWSHGGLEAF